MGRRRAAAVSTRRLHGEPERLPAATSPGRLVLGRLRILAGESIGGHSAPACRVRPVTAPRGGASIIAQASAGRGSPREAASARQDGDGLLPRSRSGGLRLVVRHAPPSIPTLCRALGRPQRHRQRPAFGPSAALGPALVFHAGPRPRFQRRPTPAPRLPPRRPPACTRLSVNVPRPQPRLGLTLRLARGSLRSDGDGRAHDVRPASVKHRVGGRNRRLGTGAGVGFAGLCLRITSAPNGRRTAQRHRAWRCAPMVLGSIVER